MAQQPSRWRLLLEATLNTFRDLVGAGRRLPPHGQVNVHYSLAGGAEPSGLAPAALRRTFASFAPAIAAAARIVYCNDTTPLAKKLPAATRLLMRHANLSDLARGLGFGLMAAVHWLKKKLSRKPWGDFAEETSAYFRAAKAARNMTPVSANASQAWDARLGQLSYETVKASHIHVHWPLSLAKKNDATNAGLWHVCPAHVYEARVNANGQLQVVVNFENCIKCETCWRTSEIVDWGRDGAQRFVYAVHSPVVAKLLADMETVETNGHWTVNGEPCSESCRVTDRSKCARLMSQLEQKLVEFDEALAAEPRSVDRDRAEYLELLARYAHQLALELTSFSRDAQRSAETSDTPLYAAALRAASRINAVVALTQRRIEHVVGGRYSWAAADGRQLRFHHLTLLRQAFIARDFANPTNLTDDPPPPDDAMPENWYRRDAIFPTGMWRDLEQQKPLTTEQCAALNQFIDHVPPFNAKSWQSNCCRSSVLADLASRDPSLAYRLACHLWARDLAMLVGSTGHEKTQNGMATDERLGLAILDDGGEAHFVTARKGQKLLVLTGSRFQVCSPGMPGLSLHAEETLGLRGAGLVRARVEGEVQSEANQTVDRAKVIQAWEWLSSSDLAAMAEGMAHYLCQRAIEHATSRVQFPGLFHDEEARDTIGKFGAIKKQIAEMAAGWKILKCTRNGLIPTSESHVLQGMAVKAVLAEVLGTAPGSIAYNAGQVFGGTGYSEDDTLSKFYRDAAAWRFLGVPNNEAFARHGSALLQAWAAGDDHLSQLPDEQAKFTEITQRKALDSELALIRTHAACLGECIDDWLFVNDVLPTPAVQAAFTEAIGRQDALLLITKHLLSSTHCRLEDGVSDAVDIPLLRTWLNKLRVAFDDFTILTSTLGESQEFSPVAYAPGSPSNAPGSLVTKYADFLQTDLPYSSGDFLNKPTDATQPRYVPEMIETDEFLCKRNKELIDLITKQFGQPRNGKVYERYLEQQHRPDAADLDFLRNHGFFRTMIPKELGGEGRSKADYYLLVVNSHRLADAAISLTIQVNSSLGTTPVLLARDKDLPKAIKATPPGELHFELNRRLEAADLFCRWVASGQISAFALTEPSAGSDTARVATRAKLRQVPVEEGADGVYIFTPVSGNESRKLIDARRVVFSASAKLQAAYRHSDTAEPAPIHFDEYDYETDACKKRYFIADGRRVYFHDIAQLRQRDGKLWYDYWELNGAKMWITNGRIMGVMVLYAKTDAGVTGFIVDRHAEGLIVGKDEAKMGQNGSPTNELALQAVRVPRENVVGLEGRGQVNALETLNVGRAGLAMSAMCQMVRLCEWSRTFALKRYGEIPPWIAWRLEWMEAERFVAEAMAYEIIGRFEHKQTKSIRMESAIAKMLVSELYHHSIELAEEIHGLEGQTQEHLIEKRKRDARVLNIYEGTNEVQRFLILKELADMGAAWASQERKQRTNQERKRLAAKERMRRANRDHIRRGSWEPKGLEKATLEKNDALLSFTIPARQIDALKKHLRELTVEIVHDFGSQVWQNPNLQASCFGLSEVVAWIAAAQSTLGRLSWHSRKGDASPELLATGWRALTRCLAETETRLERFADDWVDLQQGHYAPEIRAASLLLKEKEKPAVPVPNSTITRPLSILVVCDPPIPGVPRPRTQDGCVIEPYRVLTDGDRAALETALRLRDAGPVSIEVVAVATASAAVPLREALSLGIDRVRIVKAASAISPDCAAAALANVLAAPSNFDLVLGGAGTGNGQEGVTARLTAAALGVPLAGVTSHLAVNSESNIARLFSPDGQARQRALPMAVMIEPGLTLRSFTMDGWLKGLTKDVEIVPWPAGVAASPLEFEEPATAAKPASGEKPPQPLLPREASRLVLEAAGVEIASPAPRSAGPREIPLPAVFDVPTPYFADNNSRAPIVAVLGTDADGKLRPTARRTLDAAQFLMPFFDGAEKVALVVVPRSEEAQQRTLAELSTLTPFDLCLLAVDGAEHSDEIRCRLLVECWSGLENFPAAVVGEPWTEAALAKLAATSAAVDPIALRVRLLDRHHGRLVAESGWAKDKLRTRQTLLDGSSHAEREEKDLTRSVRSTLWLGLAAEAEIGTATPPVSRATRRIERWSPRLEKFYGREDMRRLIEELKQNTGLARLSDAEFIIDVGFGVGNRDGYEAVIEPLEHALRQLGVRSLMIGGSRKVTEELHLLPADRQIGQSGVSVNPLLLLAIGVSGAPQHLNYIGPRATIIAFNRDPEAPLMTLNQRQAKPQVYPVIGDLFETVPALVTCLREEQQGTAGMAESAKTAALRG